MEGNINPKITFLNNDMWWSTEDIGGYDYLQKHNGDTVEKLLPLLKDKKVAVQAGGNCGFVIRQLKQIFETIYTFEPTFSCFLALCMNIPDENVFKIQGCLGSENKLVGMAQPRTLVSANYVSGEGIIPTFRIDDLNLNECSLIQLDIEGFEHDALMGAVETITKFHPLLCIERRWGEERGFPEAVLDKQLADWGYVEVDRMYPDVYYKWID